MSKPARLDTENHNELDRHARERLAFWRALVPPIEPTGAFIGVDRIVDDWYDRAPLFPGEVGEEFTFPMPSPYEKKGKA